jgi:hypothetical protein
LDHHDHQAQKKEKKAKKEKKEGKKEKKSKDKVGDEDLEASEEKAVIMNYIDTISAGDLRADDGNL